MNGNRFSGGGKSSGGIIGILVFLAVCAGGLFAAARLIPAAFKVILWIVIGIMILLVVLFILLIVIALRSGKKKEGQTGETDPDEEQAAELRDAREKVMNIRRTNMQIHVMNVRNGANRVCACMDRILLALKEKPDKIRDIRQCLDYYLPTIQDVLGNFRSLEEKGQLDDDMKEKAAAFLSDVESALNNKYDALFNDDRLDMEVDMEAMTLALKRDGLL